MMRARLLSVVMVVVLTVPCMAQTRAQFDSVRAVIVSGIGFTNAAQTEMMKVLAWHDSLVAKLFPAIPVPPPLPPPPVPPVPTDPTARIYAQHDFNDGTLGRFSTQATAAGAPCNVNGVAGQCSSDIWVRNGRVEIRYQRLDDVSSADRNRALDWVPRNGTENTTFGAMLYVAATFTIPGTSGVAATSDDTHRRALRKLFYVNAGRPNHIVLAVHDLWLKYTPGVKSANGVCQATGAQVYNLMRFTEAELFDKPVRIEMEVKRSSGVMAADGEFKVWVNGRLVKHQTQVCTNRDSSTAWRLDIGQQYNLRGHYSELRALDDVIVASKRPF